MFYLNNWSLKATLPFGARRSHRMIVHNDYMWLTGGFDGANAKNDVWKSSDGVNWILVNAAAQWPIRSVHGFLHFNNMFWVFGGSASGTFRPDVWYSYDASSWYQAPDFPGAARHEFGYCTFDNKMWIIGGYDGYSRYSDVWGTSDGSSWTRTTTNFGMSVRECACTSFKNKIWVWGGDVVSYTNAMYSSSDGTSWSFDGNAAWSGRREHQVTFDTDMSNVAIIGGYNGSYLNDVWQSSNGTDWSGIAQESAYPGRSDAGFVDLFGQAYIVGGFDDNNIKNDVWTSAATVKTDFTSNTRSGDIPLAVTFYDLSTESPFGWHWNFGDGTTSDLQNPTHIYNTVGTFTVALDVTSVIGPGDRTKANYITTTVTTDFVADSTYGTAPFLVNFDDLSTGNPYIWDWNFGDGNHAYTQNPSHTYTSSGSYNVSLDVLNVGGHFSRTKNNYIKVLIDHDKDPKRVKFFDTSINDPTTWDWTFGDSSTTHIENPIKTYANYDTTYVVTLHVANKGGGDTTQMVVQTGSQPIRADYTYSVDNLNHKRINFTSTSTGDPYAWLWDFGDGTTSTTENPIHVYGSYSSDYTASLTATGNYGLDRTSGIITTGPYPQPTANFSWARSPYDVKNIVFTDLSLDATSWDWDFGDGSLHSPVRSPNHTYADSDTTYAVTQTVFNIVGSDSTTKNVVTGSTSGLQAAYVWDEIGLPPLFMDFTATVGTIFDATFINLTDNSTGSWVSWNWNFGDGATNSSQNTSHKYSSGGVKTVTLTLWDDHGVNSIVKDVYLPITQWTQRTVSYSYVHNPLSFNNEIYVCKDNLLLKWDGTFNWIQVAANSIYYNDGYGWNWYYPSIYTLMSYNGVIHIVDDWNYLKRLDGSGFTTVSIISAGSAIGSYCIGTNNTLYMCDGGRAYLGADRMGLYKWDGTSYAELVGHTMWWSASTMVYYHGGVYVGESNNLYKYDDNTSWVLAATTPDTRGINEIRICSLDDTLRIMSSGNNLYKWKYGDGTDMTTVSNSNGTYMVNNHVADFIIDTSGTQYHAQTVLFKNNYAIGGDWTNMPINTSFGVEIGYLFYNNNKLYGLSSNVLLEATGIQGQGL